MKNKNIISSMIRVVDVAVLNKFRLNLKSYITKLAKETFSYLFKKKVDTRFSLYYVVVQFKYQISVLD